METRFEYSKNAAVTFAAPAPLTAGSPQANELYTEFSSLWRQDAQLESRRCVLQPPGLRSAYHFTDVDGDGRLDALYHPAGLRTTSARVLWYQSFRQLPGASGAAAWQSPSTAPAASQAGMVRFLGLPGAGPR